MVLSNKKLKQKLREALAVSITAKESKVADEKSQTKSFKELLDSVTQKPRLSKREKRRKILPLQGTKSVEDSIGDTQKENATSEVLSEKKKKKKKRKREENGDKEGGSEVTPESNEEKPAKKSKKSKKQKAKTKMMKKKKKEEAKKRKEEEKKKLEEGGNSKGVQDRKDEVKEEPVEAIESQENADVAAKVYVGGIPYYSTEDDIYSFFEACGTITEMDCMTFPETGKFRGIAMITFKTEAAAKRALALDGADMGGLFLKIQPYKINRVQKSADFAPKIVEGYNRVYVGNLSWDITEEELKNFFADCKVSSIRFGKDKTTDEFRGYAHVDFSDSLSLTIALKLDQKVLCGRPVKISCAVPRKETVPKKVAETQSIPDTINKKAENDSLSCGGEKKKRRTCYECGVPGHISSDCPNKKAVDLVVHSSQE